MTEIGEKISKLLIKSGVIGLFVTLWLIFSPSDKAHAEDITVQVSPEPSSETSTATIEVTVQATITNAQTAVSEAQTAVQTVSDQVNSLSNSATVDQAIAVAQESINTVSQNIQTTQNAVSDLNNAQTAVLAQTSVVETTTASVEVATQLVTTQTSVVSQAATQVATDSQNLETQTQNLEQAQTNLTTAQAELQTASTAVSNQEPIVATAQVNKDAAQAVVDANTTPGLNVTIYSNPGTNGSPAMGGNVVYTGTDTNGINEQWGSGGPTVNGATTTTTITETFAGNHLNTTIGVTVDGTTVNTTSNGGTYIGAIGFPAPGQDPVLVEQGASKNTLITLPANTTSAGFDVFAKNGNSTGTVTYTDGTTETFVIQDDVNANYPGYVHKEIFTAPAGKKIATILVPADWDYYGIDNISATSTTTATTTVTEDFQVRWQGLWTPQTTGTQYIYAPADDGTKLYLDGQLVINDWYDKGGGGSTADVATTAGVSKTFDFWFYENGGGANVALKRYTGSGWEIIPASEFSTSTATATQLSSLATAVQTLNTEQATLSTLQQALSTAQNNVNTQTNVVAQQTLVVQTAQNDLQISNQSLSTAQQDLITAQTSLSEAQSTLQSQTQTLSNLQNQVQSAEIAVSMAVSTLSQSVQTMQQNVANAQTAYTTQANIEEQQRIAAAIAAAIANMYRPAPVEPTPVVDTPSNPDPTPTDTPTDPTPEVPVDETPTDTPSDNPDTTDTTDSTDQTNSDTTTEDSSNQDNSSSDNTDTSSQPTDSTDTPTDNTQTQPEPTPAPTPEPSSQDNSTPGLTPNSPDQLSDTVVKEAPASVLVPHIQVDKPGVENGGIEFFGTKSQPQVVGEDGKLTPPPPPPGSGLPIPPDAITTIDTFIGQPGGTSFNAPDIAVPVIMSYVCTTVTKEDGTEVHIDLDGNEHPIEQCTFLPAALDAIPGAGQAIQAMGAAYAALANIGNDMSPLTRKKAKKVLVLTAAVVAFRRRFGSD